MFLRTVVLAPLILLAVVLGAMNLGAEVVTLTTVDPDGARFETPIWILDDGEDTWIRAERPTSDWLARLSRNPEVEIERGGHRAHYRAVPSPDKRAYVNTRMVDRYGWIETLLAVVQSRDASVPIRLVPSPPEAVTDGRP